MRPVALLLLGLLLTACPAGPTPTPGEPTPGIPATPPPDLGLPAQAEDATPWRDAGLPPAFDDDARHGSPQQVVDAVGDALLEAAAGDGPPLDVNAEVLSEDEATASGRVVIGGFADDSVYGGDHFLALARDDAGWYVAQMWERDLCRRGTADGLCL